MKSTKQKLGWGGVAVATLALGGMVAPAQADDAEMKATLRELAGKIEAMQAEQKRMQSKLDEAESKLAAKAAAPATVGQAVTGGDIPGSFKLPGSTTSVSLSGYVSARGIWNSRAAGALAGDETLNPPLMQLDNAVGVRTNNWKMHAKDSRLILKTSTPSDYGPITTLLEADFFGAAGSELVTNGHGFRVRHAWGTIGKLSAGQYWSNAVNLSAVPENIDYTPTIGVSGAWRQTQFRWTEPLANGFWSVSVENPESVVVLNSTANGASTFPDNDKAPDFTAKYHFGLGGGDYELSGIVRKLTANTAQQSVSKTGYALSFSGSVPVFDKNALLFGINGSKNTGRHLGGLAHDMVVLGTATAPVAEAVDTNAGFLAYRHFWTPSVRSNLNYSWININNPSGISAGTAAGLNKKFTTTHLNLIWAPAPSVDLGVEYLYATRKVESGLKGDLDRVTFMAKYKF